MFATVGTAFCAKTIDMGTGVAFPPGKPEAFPTVMLCAKESAGKPSAHIVNNFLIIIKFLPINWI